MKNKKPAIRFKGFSEDWEEKSFGELCDSFGYGLNAASKEYDGINKYIRITDIDEDSRNFNINGLTSPDTDLSLAENYQLNLGDVLFARTGASVGKTYIYKEVDGLVYFAGFLIRGRIKKDVNTEFIFQNTLTNRYEQFVRLTSQRSGQPGINAQEYSSFRIKQPQIDEQTQIGNFFKNLDSLITLHQRKVEKLGILKKAMLEKMFPKNEKNNVGGNNVEKNNVGEVLNLPDVEKPTLNVPEIRFKGFEGAWEERTLGEISDVIDGDRGHNYPNGNELQSVGHTLFLSATNVTTNGFKFDNNQYITEEKSNSMGNGKLIVNDIVLTSRGSIGHIAWYNEIIQQEIPFARINSGMLILRSKDFMIPSFISQFLKSPLGKKQINLISFGSAQPQLTKKDISNYSVAFPNYEEQEKIGNYFKNLDKLLTLHQGELGKLKNLKKAMLEKMFV